MDTSVSLLERLAAQPRDADWRNLVDLYRPLLRAWLVRAGVPAADQDDLSQEILLVVVREVKSFERRRPGAFRAWLRTILVHRVRDFFRGRKHRPVAGGGSAFLDRLAELESPGSELSRLWDREHDEFVAARAMERVRPTVAAATWNAFQRYVLDNVPAATVAADLGMSLNSVLLAKSRILKRVRQELNGLVD